MTEESLFAAALERATDAERRAFLAEAAAGDDALRHRVERLLAADGHAGGPLDGDLDRGPPPDSPPVAEGPGDYVGRYKLKEQIGEGGFGLVFVAEQAEPVRRKVAVKVIKPGMDTREVVARFEGERQALALMDHPNIARVLDAGTTESGRPYFVMELVRGVAVTEYTDGRRLSTRDRLELFASVCQAVQHAHQKGVIHRDIKPTNVLVTEHDGRPVVKVIDFGVAKALNQQLTEHSVYTRFAQMVGTPTYMSPEQAALSGLDVDTRADIYSLGVLLYELLTGTTPFDRERLRTAGFDEIRRIIREEEPPRPSARVSTLGRAAATVVADGRGDPRRLSRMLRGELDWIVMKCLEKDRTRRYETAADLARDVGRYLRDEPVEASPPSTVYRARKLLRRHRGPALAAAVIALLLVGGVVGTTWGMVGADRARAAEADRAESEATQRRRAEAAEGQARAKAREATDAARIAVEIDWFVRQDLLFQGAHETRAHPELTVREALDRAATRVDRLRDEPLVEAAVRKTVGEAYRHLGLSERAIPHLRRSADLLTGLRGPTHADTLDVLHALALAHLDARQTADAVRLFEQVRDAQVATIGPDHERTLTTLSNLAVAYRDAGRTAEALALHERVRDARVRVLGPDDPATLATRHNIAAMTLDAGKTAQAIEQLERVRTDKIRVLGPEHPDLLPTLSNLGKAYWKAKRLDKSVPLFEALVPLHEKVLGKMHSDTLRAVANLGVNYRDAGRLDEAISLLERAREAGRTHASLRWVDTELLIAYVRAKKSKEAAALARQIVAAARQAHPAGGPAPAGVLANSGAFLVQVGAWVDAEKFLRECVTIREQAEPDDWRTFNAKALLGAALLGGGKLAEAEPLLVAGYEGMKRQEAAIPAASRVRLNEALERLVQVSTARGDAAGADRWRRELDARRRR